MPSGKPEQCGSNSVYYIVCGICALKRFYCARHTSRSSFTQHPIAQYTCWNANACSMRNYRAADATLKSMQHSNMLRFNRKLTMPKRLQSQTECWETENGKLSLLCNDRHMATITMNNEIEYSVLQYCLVYKKILMYPEELTRIANMCYIPYIIFLRVILHYV